MGVRLHIRRRLCGLITLAAAVLSLGGVSSQARAADQSPIDFSRLHVYPILQVIDGDTIVIKHDSRGVLMQLRGVAGGAQGKRFLAGMLEGESVHLVYAPEGPRDRAGHFSAYFFRVRDRVFLNELMIKRGQAATNDDHGPHEKLFHLHEERARAQKIGRWADPDDDEADEPAAGAQERSARRAAPAATESTGEQFRAAAERRRARLAGWRRQNETALAEALEFEAAQEFGVCTLTINNDRDAAIKVNLHGPWRPISVVVPAGSRRSIQVVNQFKYQTSMQFEDEPGEVYRGDSVLADSNDPTITIGTRHDGNFAVRKAP
jgi:endonuclease YncB( thermonuclease family)